MDDIVRALLLTSACVQEHQDHQKGVAKMSIDTALHVFPDMCHYEVRLRVLQPQLQCAMQKVLNSPFIESINV